MKNTIQICLIVLAHGIVISAAAVILLAFWVIVPARHASAQACTTGADCAGDSGCDIFSTGFDQECDGGWQLTETYKSGGNCYNVFDCYGTMTLYGKESEGVCESGYCSSNDTQQFCSESSSGEWSDTQSTSCGDNGDGSGYCGDGICDSSIGENSSTCPQDCGSGGCSTNDDCAGDQTCQNGTCVNDNQGVTLTATPASGSSPLSTTLAATLNDSGLANTGVQVSYYYWWNCDYPTSGYVTEYGPTAISDVEGYCSTYNAVDTQYGTNQSSETHSYSPAGAYTPFVLAVYGNSLGVANTPVTVTAPLADNASCTSFTATPSTASPGQTVSFTANVLNNGASTWTNAGGFAFLPLGGTTWGSSVYSSVSSSVSPNNTANFNFNVTAPATPGTYTLNMQMIHQGICCFGAGGCNSNACNGPALCSTSVTVTATTGCTTPGPGSNQLIGCVYNDAGLGSSPNMTTVYANAPTGATASGNADNFTALPQTDVSAGLDGLANQFGMIWQGTFNFTGGNYVFNASSDDGQKLYVDGNQVINDWVDQGFTLATSPVTLSPGAHIIKYQYYQNGGGAAYSLNWSRQAPPAISLSSLINVAAAAGGSAPPSQPLTITDTGGGALNWTGTNNTPTICTLNRTTGSASANGGTDFPLVQFASPTSSIVGSNTCTVTINDSSGQAVSQNASNTYTVTPADTCSGGGCGTCGGGVCGGGGGGSSVTVTATAATCPSTGVVLAWPSASGANSYNIYRNTSNSAPSSPITNTTSTTYADSSTSGPYYYWVQSVNNSGLTGDKVAANSGSSVSPTSSCVTGSANLNDSDKDIMAINGTPVIETQTGNPPQPCNGTDPLPANTALNAGDNLKFQINLCNDQGTASANGISLSDTLINLQMPTGGWNVQYCDGGSCGSVTPTVTGTAPNQTLTFSLSSIAKASIANLTFNAVLAPPSGNTSSTSRFQNSFVINYTANSPVSGHTPLIPFYAGSNTPTIHEVP